MSPSPAAASDLAAAAALMEAVPQDLLAELCEQVLQHLQLKVPAVDAPEVLQRWRAAGVTVGAHDLAKVIGSVSLVFSTAAKNQLSSEELSAQIGKTFGFLPKQAVQVIRHMWNEKGKSVVLSEDGKNLAAAGQLLDCQWTLGMAVGADSCKSLKSPYVTMAVKVADASGRIVCRTFEMTVPQFQNFHSQFKDMASLLETL